MKKCEKCSNQFKWRNQYNSYIIYIANVTFWFKNIGSLFKRDGVVEKVNPFKQTSMAKALGINISDRKRLF